MTRKIILIICHVIAIPLIAYIFIIKSNNIATTFLNAYLGDHEAQSQLADYYEKKSNFEQVKKWRFKSAAGNYCQGYINYAVDTAKDNNIPEAISFLEKCANIGCLECGEVLTKAFGEGTLFENYGEKSYKMEIDPVKAEVWAEKTGSFAIPPNENAEYYKQLKMRTWHLCGVANFFDKNGKKNFAKAAKCLEKEIQMLPEINSSINYDHKEDAYKILGTIYLYGGYGVEKNEEKGAGYFLTAKHPRNLEAIKVLFNGKGTKKDITEAKILATQMDFVRMLYLPSEQGYEFYNCRLKEYGPYREVNIEARKEMKKMTFNMEKKEIVSQELIEKKEKKFLTDDQWEKLNSVVGKTDFFNLPSSFFIHNSILRNYRYTYIYAMKDGQIQLLEYGPSIIERPGEKVCEHLFEMAGLKFEERE